MQPPVFLIATAAAVLLGAHAHSAETGAAANGPVDFAASLAARVEPMVVSATRTMQSGFALPVSIDRIDQARIQQAGPRVQLSESLVRVPGIVVQNRHNYAQDVQISSRGFGARSTFGVRGIRLYVDGIPATMPDGQGQTSHIDLTSAARIEVLRGPFSALYGNSSGGVLSIFTEDGQPGAALTSFVHAGSYGTRHVGVKASGQQDATNYVLSTAHFDTEGFRMHSAASRDTANAKLRMQVGSDAALTLVGNGVQMRDVQDPLGLTRERLQADPAGAEPLALAFNTRKSVCQQQWGMRYEKFIHASHSVQLMAYGGQRTTEQYLALPPAAQSAPTSAGGVIDLQRDYRGLDVRWSHEAASDGAWQWVAGVSMDEMKEQRRGYENGVGAVRGVQGRLRRDERNRVSHLDQYAQLQWTPDARWVVLAGLRHSRIQVHSDDRYLAPGNGDDSGSTRYHATTPVLGATFKLTPRMHLYAAYGRGFETPTLNELSYRPVGGNAGDAASRAAGGFHFALAPATSRHYETGLKARLADQVRAQIAAFHVATRNELSVLSNTGGRAVYQNAGATRRHGIELQLEGEWGNGMGALLSYSSLHAVYRDGFCAAACTAATRVPPGNRIPGTARDVIYAELSWRRPALGLSAALEGKYVGKMYVDDSNSDAAPHYAVANLRLQHEQRYGAWQLRGFARIENIGNRRYVGAVIVNESNRRFFEPAPPPNYLLGLAATYQW